MKTFKPQCGHTVEMYGMYGVSKIDNSGYIDLCWNCLAKIETVESDNTISDLKFKNIHDEQSYSKTGR